MFQKGVTIIDSPGVGESEVMDEVVTEYLPQAFGFIYVINSANAGGVQKDRVSSQCNVDSSQIKILEKTIYSIAKDISK